MEEMMKLLTPQNFAMVVAIYLLLRFENAIKNLEEGFEDSLYLLRESLDRNTRLLCLLLDRQGSEDAVKELTASVEKDIPANERK